MDPPLPGQRAPNRVLKMTTSIGGLAMAYILGMSETPGPSASDGGDQSAPAPEHFDANAQGERSGTTPSHVAPRSALTVDAWLVAPDTAPKRVADTRRQPMRLSALFEEFCHFLRVEKEAAPRTIETYRWCFKDYESFGMKQIGGTVLVAHFTAEACRAYQYDLAARALQTSSIRVRLATLGSFGKWAVRRDKIARNPVDALTRPRRKARLPRVPRWDTVERLLEQCTDWREKALLALMCYGGLRRSEIVALDVGDVAPGLGLRRVQGKGGTEVAVPLPAVARKILGDYIAMVRMKAAPAEPLFVSRFKAKGGRVVEGRMKSHRVWKVTKAIGARGGVPELHPHAFRHSCGVELLRRSNGNLRAVQEHLRHADIQTTTVYTRLTQSDLQKVISAFDNNNGGENRDSHPAPHGT
jgi:site-specific recombinase XerD